MNHYDVIVLGGGAAGMMAAIEAGKRGRKVLLVDHADHVGDKIRISGGGRCNFTNINATVEAGRERFLSQNPRFALSALSRYTPDMFIALVKNTASPSTRRRSANCSAMARPPRSTPCCSAKCGSRV